MVNDYNVLKNKYGERFARLCRELFPTLLENKGVLTKLITSRFDENKMLYDDIVENDLKDSFKNFVLRENQKPSEEGFTESILVESPFELMKRAGYNLYKCETDEDVKSFKPYWKKEEELCTFKDDKRIDRNYIFFAVKDNVEEIKRENFKNPKRQDEYGTSVISLQFTKREPNILSIKNRYNHTVVGCDATFSNDPENIIAGLTDAFVNEYGLNFTVKSKGFEIPNYVLSNKGKFYRFNFEKDNTYYCTNKVINQDREVDEIDASRFILIDNYIVDTKIKRVLPYDLYNQIKNEENVDIDRVDLYLTSYKDSFIDSIGEISNIEVTKSEEGRTITITPNEGENVIVDIDKNNSISGYTNINVTKIGDDFLSYNRKIKHLNVQNIEEAGKNFLLYNTELTEIFLPKVKKLSHNVLSWNEKIEKADFSSLEEADDFFLSKNQELTEAIFPTLRKLGGCCLKKNQKIKKVDFSSLEEAGKDFLSCNRELVDAYFPKVKVLGYNCLTGNNKLQTAYFPKLEKTGSGFLYRNEVLKKWYFPVLIAQPLEILYSHKDREVIRNNIPQGDYVATL